MGTKGRDQSVLRAHTCSATLAINACICLVWQHHYSSQEMISPTEICRCMARMTPKKAPQRSPIRTPSHVSVAQPEGGRLNWIPDGVFVIRPARRLVWSVWEDAFIVADSDGHSRNLTTAMQQCDQFDSAVKRDSFYEWHIKKTSSLLFGYCAERIIWHFNNIDMELYKK